MSGPAANPATQAALRGLDLRADALRAGRWENLLKTPWGRALVYELIWERGNVTGRTFDPNIKDGVCAAIHQAHTEGLREFALGLLEELNALFPDQMLLMHSEMTATRQAERAQRQQAITRSATTED